MDDVECVRCSACIVNCPMDVLSFGRIGRDGELVPPKLHATLFEPVDWQAVTVAGQVHASYPRNPTDTYIHDPVKKARG
jgi:ferredoxin